MYLFEIILYFTRVKCSNLSDACHSHIQINRYAISYYLLNFLKNKNDDDDDDDDVWVDDTKIIMI